jgi:pimeloyl-ACP methyl ester carboxylesterase
MNTQIQRPNGRKLAYLDVGPRNGTPLFYFHGVPSASAEWRVWGNEDLLNKVGVRLIAVDRPGVGASSFQPKRKLIDWPAEVTVLADSLGFERFSVLGYSGGGPYAAVCAALLPKRLGAAGMVSSLVSFDHTELLAGINPGNVQFLKLSIQKPLLYQFIYWQISLLAKFAPQKYLERALSTFGEADREVFTRPEVHQALFSATGSPRGQQWDARLILSPWDFRLEDIHMPVYLWQGDQDHNASPAMGRYLEQALPNSRMTFLPGEGHISLIVKYAETILKTLTQDR